MLAQCIKVGSGDWRTHWAVGKGLQRKRYLSDARALLPGGRGRRVRADRRARSRQEAGPGPEGGRPWPARWPPGVVYRLGAGEWLLWRGQGAQEDLGSQVPWRRASADRASPGTRWAGSSRCSCTGYRSRPPPRRHSWTGRAPRTCPAGERPRSDPPAAQNASPGDWDPGRGVRPLLCSGAAPEPLFSGHRQARVGSRGRPHLLVQLVAGAQRLLHGGAVVRQVQVKQVHAGAPQPLEGRLQLGPEAVGLQGVFFQWIGLGSNFYFGMRKIEVQVNLPIIGEDLGLMVKRQAWVHTSALPIPAL